MRLFVVLFLMCSVAQAKDVSVYLIDKESIDTVVENKKFIGILNTHFRTKFNLEASQRLYCVKGARVDKKTKKQIPFNTCEMVEEGECTKKQFAKIFRSINGDVRLSVDKIVGDKVTYRIDWKKAETKEGPRRKSIVSYLRAVHSDVSEEFMLEFVVGRIKGKINAGVMFESVIDDSEIAQYVLDGSLVREVPPKKG